MSEELYKICEDCKHSVWYSEDPGYSPRECGLSSNCITYMDGCNKDVEPYYDEEEETVTCKEFESNNRF